MRIVFMGSPDFSVPTLSALSEAGHEIVLVVTQPDRPAGRGKALRACAVKEAALSLGLPVFSPERVKSPEALERIRGEKADIGVVVAFGQILPETLLEMMPFGCVNVHASLLPKYRGASPIQHAILAGEAETGVTTMQMGPGLDDGPVLLQRKITIAPDETGDSLFEKLAPLGAALCVETLHGLEKGTVQPCPQDETQATKVGLIRKEMGCLDFSRPAAELERRVRGLYAWPGAYTHFQGKRLKIHEAQLTQPETAAGLISEADVLPGTVLAVTEIGITVACGEGALLLKKVQPQGRKVMPAADYCRGSRLKEGARLGEDEERADVQGGR